jgi:ribosomal protein L7Ae-like RNA K-turn-binding protein
LSIQISVDFDHFEMSRRPRLQQKQILRLDSTISLPSSCVDSPDSLLALLCTLFRADNLAVGISSVGRALIHKKVAVLLFASDVNPPALIQHLLQMACQSKTPVIATGISVAALGKGLGLNSAAVIGVLRTAGDEVIELLRPFAAEIPPPQLPFLRVETDFFIPRQ